MTDGDDELIFYRHSDGYPDGTLPTLGAFLDLVRSEVIRDNVGQASGWLILIGAQEYGVNLSDGSSASKHGLGMSWKCGSYEPTTALHGDIDFLYVVDLKAKRIRHRKVGRDAAFNAVVSRSFYSGRFNPVNVDLSRLDARSTSNQNGAKS